MLGAAVRLRFGPNVVLPTAQDPFPISEHQLVPLSYIILSPPPPSELILIPIRSENGLGKGFDFWKTMPTRRRTSTGSTPGP